MSDVKMVLGCQASGKSTLTKEFVSKGYVTLNRDTEGGTIADLLPKMENLLKDNKKIVLDNTFPKVENRKPFIEMAKKYNKEIECVWINTSIEDATFNCVNRIMKLSGKFLSPEEIKKSKHPNIFPPLVLFKYKKEFEKPSTDEGFASVSLIEFKRQDDPTFINKAIITDYDGCVRNCINGNDKYPVLENQVQINAKCKKILLSFKDKGYKILGVSNQSGVHKGELSHQKAVELFNHTNNLLGVNIDYRFCPHQSAPISCYCRKPMCGFGVEFILKYKLDRKNCLMIGDMTTDKTFSTRCGFQYVDQADFYK